MKKILSTALIFLLVLSVSTGCGNTVPPSGTTSSGSSSAPTEKKEPVNIEFWWAGSGEASESTAKRAAELVNGKYDDIVLTSYSISWNDYPTKCNVAFAGGTAPELFALGFNQLYANLPNCLPLDDYLKDWDGYGDIPQSIIDFGKVEGNFYGYLYPGIRLLTYRKDMFEKAGLDPDKPPRTKEELYDYAKRLTEYDDTGNIKVAGYELPSTGGDQGFFPLLNMFGIYNYWDENYDLTLNKPEALEAVKYAQKFFTDKISMYSDQLSVQGSLFENGMSAMTLSVATSQYGAVFQKVGADKIGIALPPSGKSAAAGSFICVYKDTKKVDAAIKAFTVLAGKEMQLALATSEGYIPTRASAKDEYIAMAPDLNSIIFEGMQSPVVFGVANPHFYDFRESAFNPFLEQMYYGKVTPEECVEYTIQKYNELRKE